MYRIGRLLLMLLMVCLLAVMVTTTVQLQQHTVDAAVCTQLVELAIQEVGNNCGGMDRNSTCYGYNRVDASFAGDVPEDFFSRPADRAGLTDLLTIQTAPFEPSLSQWGVALMNVQANVPNTLPGQAVTFILMGDVKVENAVDPASRFVPSVIADVMIRADLNARVRSGPNQNFNVLATLNGGTVVKADAVNAARDWVRVALESSNGWVYKDLLADSSMLAELSVLTETSRTPMQSFYFTSGIGEIECADAPDVLFVQGPKGVKVDLTVNGADIQIGSTVAFTSKSSTYSRFSSDNKLIQTYSTTLTGKNVPADAQCQMTTMVMLEGVALLNEAVSVLPIGYSMDSISCVDDMGDLLLTTPWRDLERLSQEDLEQFAVIEQIPDNVLRYHVDLPTDQQIDQQERRYLSGDLGKPKPQETAESMVTEEATPTPSDGGQPTDVPPEQTPEA